MYCKKKLINKLYLGDSDFEWVRHELEAGISRNHCQIHILHIENFH